MAPGPMEGTKARRRFDPLLSTCDDGGGGGVVLVFFCGVFSSMRGKTQEGATEIEKGKEKEATSQTLNPKTKFRVLKSVF